MKTLRDRAAWITGGASGIGLALAHRLAREGTALALVDIEAEPLAEAEAELRAAGARVIAIRADVSNADDMAAAAARAQAELGTIHLICNNAGVGGGGGPLWEVGVADWKWSLDVNLWGVIHGIRLLLPPLLASGQEGHVVNTASIAGLTSTPFLGPYTAAKHAVVALSECLVKELELVRAKVGVSVLCPGFVKTKIAGSDRNRPERRVDASPLQHKVGQVLHQLVDSGIEANQVADAIVAAVSESRFYILTHPDMKPQIAHRMHQILDEQPPGIDPLFRSIFSTPES